MRIESLSISAVLASIVFCFAVPKVCNGSPQGDKAFTGEIMDSQCAAMGSHQQMMKPEGAKDAKECTLKCVQMGGKFVLYDSSKKAVYQLDDQKKAKQFAGQRVKITGSEESAKAIHVQNIEPAS